MQGTKTKQSECKFCHGYAILKEIETRNADSEFGKRYKPKYFAQLVSTYWDTVNKQSICRGGHDTVTLKYCPLCGKKLGR